MFRSKVFDGGSRRRRARVPSPARQPLRSTGIWSNSQFPVYCFDLVRNIVATDESGVVTDFYGNTGLSLNAVVATVDPGRAVGWGCAAGTDAVVVGRT
jgi:hypothetical protein